MSETNGLVYAFRLDGKGGGDEIGWDGAGAANEAGLLWLHLDFDHPQARHWLEEESGIP